MNRTSALCKPQPAHRAPVEYEYHSSARGADGVRVRETLFAMSAKHFCLVAAAAAVAASLAAAPIASARGTVKVVGHIDYSDLDLSTPAGGKAMLQRIKVKVARLCAPDPSPLFAGTSRASDTRRCRANALQRAVVELGSPLVTAEYSSENPQFATANR